MEPRIISRTIDLAVEYQTQQQNWGKRLMLTGSIKADRLVLKIVNGDEPVDLTGLHSRAYFETLDGDVVVDGEISDNVIAIDFPTEAYAYEGLIKVKAYLSDGERNIPLYVEKFDIGQGYGNTLIDPTDIIPNMAELLVQLSTIKDATAEANTAAGNANGAATNAENAAANANTAAGKANTAAGNANGAATNAENAAANASTAAGEANTAAGNANGAATNADNAAANANTAAGKANTAAGNANGAATNAENAAANASTAAGEANTAAANADKWANAEAVATRLAAGSQPTVTITEKDGKKQIAFGIPEGAPGSNANVTAQTISSALGYTPASNADLALLKGNVENTVSNLASGLDSKVNNSGYSPNKYIGTDSSGKIVEKNAPTVSGDGLPTSGDPYQMLVTDENGNSVWEPRTHYDGVERATVMPETQIDVDGTSSIDSYMEEDIEAGKKYIVTLDGEEYGCTAFIGSSDYPEQVYLTDTDTLSYSVFRITRYGKKQAYITTKVLFEHTLGIQRPYDVIKPLDGKYLTGNAPTAHQMLVTDAEGKAKWEDIKQITGEVDLAGKITFSMPFADMVALGESLREYDITIMDGHQRYKVFDLIASETSVRLLFLGASTGSPDRIKTIPVNVINTGASIDYSLLRQGALYDLPDPTREWDKYLGTDDSGNYVLKDAPTSSTAMPVLQMLDIDGVLAFVDVETGQPVPVTLEMLMEVCGEGIVNLKVFVMDNAAGIHIYSFGHISISEDPEHPPYILFTGDTGKTIRMEADGTLSYAEELQLATEEYVQAQTATPVIYMSTEYLAGAELVTAPPPYADVGLNTALTFSQTMDMLKKRALFAAVQDGVEIGYFIPMVFMAQGTENIHLMIFNGTVGATVILAF